MEAIGTQGAVCYRIGDLINLFSSPMDVEVRFEHLGREVSSGMIHVPPISVEVFEV